MATSPTASRLRLTRRGRIVAVAALALLLLVLASLMPWRASADPGAGHVPEGWTTVVVRPGDSLWELAQQSRPGADPRPLVAEIRAANGMSNATLQPGTRLLVPAG